MINFNDHKAVKELIFDLMIENRELKTQLAETGKDKDFWYNTWDKLNQAEKVRQEQTQALNSLPVVKGDSDA